MVLKRKRSESELSSFSSASSSLSSPLRPSSSSAMNMCVTSPTPSASMSTPSHLPSRTRKRFRDSRPSEAEVHQRTLDMLYSAAQRPEVQPEMQSGCASAWPNPHPRQYHQPTPPISSTHSTVTAPQQRSLHNFWNLPAPSTQSADGTWSASTEPHTEAPTCCEDCGRGLRSGGGGGNGAMEVDMMSMDVDMDLDAAAGGSGDAAGCAGCGKHVCSHCSIADLGLRARRCLVCAGHKVWVGGLGWTAAGTGTAVAVA